jgi:hypothetical protein
MSAGLRARSKYVEHFRAQHIADREKWAAIWKHLLLHPAVILGYNFTVEYRDEFMSEEAINFAVFSSAEITATPPLSFCVTCRFSD